MPAIGSGTVGTGKTYAVGFWQSQTCFNSLAKFPSDTDYSWGFFAFYLDGVDGDNYMTLKILDTSGQILISKVFNTKGLKKIDLSQFSAIGSTDDIKIMIEITTYI
jgi:hypothetical protein